MRVYVVDDHEIVREPLVTLLAAEPWINVVGDSGTAEQALREASALRPDVVLVDRRLGEDADGLDLCAQLRAVPGVHVIVMTAFPTPDLPGLAIAAGADGFITKSAAIGELLHAIRAVASGLQHAEPLSLGPLSAQELAVLRLYAAGRRPGEIAEEVEIGRTSVDEYLRRCVQKLGARNRPHAAAIAVRRGLL